MNALFLGSLNCRNSNYESRKAQDITENPRAALLFSWSGLNREARVEGTVQKISEEESEHYFYSRPKESQIAALVSKQVLHLFIIHIHTHKYISTYLFSYLFI